MASNNNDERWYFTKDQLDNSPSRQCGIEAYKELSYRQQAANFIQDLGQRLKVSQLCINTAIVYMHRFYVFHSFTHFPWHLIASAALFLAAKVEEQPRKLEHVIRVANLCKNPRDTTFDTTSERYLAQSQDLVFNENILLQTLGFDVAIDHPNTHVVKCCHLVKAGKDLAQTSYFMASNSLHLTTMCLQYKPTVVACFCIHLACKWSNWEIPLSNEKKEWFSYVDPTVTSELLAQLTEEFLVIFERSPSRLKEKIRMIGEGQGMQHQSPPLEDDKRSSLFVPPEQKEPHSHRSHHLETKSSSKDDIHKRSQKVPHEAGVSGQRDREKEREYRERKERERMANKYPGSLSLTGKYPGMPGYTASKHMPPVHGGHHSSQLSSTEAKMKAHGRPPHTTSSAYQNLTKNAFRDASSSSSGEAVNENVGIVKEFQKPPTLPREGNQRQESRPLANSDVISDVNDLDKRLTEIVRSSTKVPSADLKPITNKHDLTRKRDELKTQTEIKKHLSSDYLDKNTSNSHTVQSLQSLKSPLVSGYQNKVVKSENNTSYLSLPSLADNTIPSSIKREPPEKELPIKRPSLFSPEASPPTRIKTPPQLETCIKPHQPQELPKALINSSNSNSTSKRNRRKSNSSEPELKPVVKNVVDQVEGFENLFRDSSIGLKLQVPDFITPITEQTTDVKPSIAKDLKPPDLILPFLKSTSATSGGRASATLTSPIVPQTTTHPHHPLINGLETNPTIISNLLKEAPAIPHLPTVVNELQEKETKQQQKEQHHKERKKNKKEKHKHKDKSKEEKEKKKKHKDKEKHKHKYGSGDAQVAPSAEAIVQPIKITIPKDKIQPVESAAPAGLKITIPKDRIKTESLENNSHGQLKIRIPKGVINLANNNQDNHVIIGKKRERDRSSPGAAAAATPPPSKVSKSNHKSGSELKQNGKNSYNKVPQVMDGNLHKLAESKFNKEASV